ncbi:serine/threonine-protein phosphatase 2A regulatory subunit B'' subunit beta-like isoform X4 [Onychomys torridus]|uniref:serine/threonine-protein phosphatase 2A regulatory subunit B'' subunit beta-like isoform X4 n=1 Tax=Onychomys torridus TaxID=38674 RepID=UPI00167F8DB9|nr:serine/threonine-protein phosphatase 2A regulatory subunit B'' subunit beta-like isoform X4 [Onychomys torridus]
MAPGKALTPVLKRKVDELFLRWLSDPDTQRALHDGLHRIRAAAGHAGSSGNVRHDPQATGHSTIFRYGPPAAGDAGNSWNVRHDPPWSSGNVRHDPSAAGDARSSGNVRHDPSAAGDARSAAGHGGSSGNVHQGLSVTRASKAPPPGLRVPAFFFPGGRPVDVDVDAAVARVLRVFARFPCERAKMADMGAVAKACGCPLYWKAPLFHAAGGGRTGSVSVHTFVTMWRKVLLTCHDDAAKFVQLLVKPGRDGLEQEDFAPFLQDVVNSHPGLSFLKEVPEFRAPYIATVTQRIFYTVNRSWSGRITCSELRRSRFLQSVSQLEVEPDINRMTAFFSLAHVRVIVCKFQELDTDGDLRLDARDLGRYADGAISSRMIDRIFSGAVTRGGKGRQDGKMGFSDFVWFLLSEEDKTTPTSVEYWFRCMDLDGDGVVSLFELEHFYTEQARRLEALDVEPLPFRDCACQVLDMLRLRTPGERHAGASRWGP